MMSGIHSINRGFQIGKSYPLIPFGQILELIDRLDEKLPELRNLETADYWDKVFPAAKLSTLEIPEIGEFSETCISECLKKVWSESVRYCRRNKHGLGRDRSSFKVYPIQNTIPIMEDFLNSEEALEIFYPDFPRIPRCQRALDYFISLNKPKNDKKAPLYVNFPDLARKFNRLEPEQKLEHQEKLMDIRRKYLEERDKFLESHQYLPNIDELRENSSWRTFEFTKERRCKIMVNNVERKKVASEINLRDSLDLDGFKLFQERYSGKYAKKHNISGEALEKVLRKKYDKLPLVKRQKLEREIAGKKKALNDRIRLINQKPSLKQRKPCKQYVNPVTGESSMNWKNMKGKLKMNREKVRLKRVLECYAEEESSKNGSEGAAAMESELDDDLGLGLNTSKQEDDGKSAVEKLISVVIS